MRRNTALLASAALGAVAIGEFYRFVFVNPSDPILERYVRPVGHEDWYYERRDGDEARIRSLPCREYSLTSVRGKKLKGFYYLCGDKPSGKIAFIIHGYRAEHAVAAGIHFDYYISRGYDVFCPDHEAAGESEGHVIGYDYFESQDCLNWLNFLIKELGEDIQIVLHGYSMGGGTVLKMSDRVPEQVKFIVSDSGFDSAENILNCQVGQTVCRVLRVMNRVIGGYDLRDTDVRENMKNSRIPILFVHGELDETVPYYMGPELYELYGGEKDCLFVPGARHIESMYIAPEQYTEKLDSFAEKYIRQ